MVRGTKIAFVMPWHISERGGGAEVQANYLAEALAERGYEVHYICQTKNAHKINTEETQNTLTIHWLQPSGRFHWLDQNKYLERLKQIKPNLAIQRLSSNVSYVIGKYCKKNNCKFIWICTDNMSPYKDFHIRKFKKSSTLGTTSFATYFSFMLNARLMDHLRNKGMRKVDIAFTQNEYQHQKVKEEFGIESKRMISGHKIPKHCISEKERFELKTVIWCGNFGKNKRPELFVELANTLTDNNIRLIMIGDHSDRSYVESILKHKPSNLMATGQVTFEESLSFFDEASLLVNTSLLEGFSNTYIQAWLRGVPTVVFGADPNNVIKNNKLGFVARDINDANDFITKLFASFDDYNSVSKRVKTFALENHTIDIMTDAFLEDIGL